MTFTLQEIIYTFENIKNNIEYNRKFLDILDNDIGDGDHGSEISVGFISAVENIKRSKFNDWNEILKAVGKSIISNCNGHSGVLYGNMFIQSSVLGYGKKEMSLKDFRDVLLLSVNSIKEKGHCTKGDKTILDGLIPVYEEVNYGIDNGLQVENILFNAIVSSRHEVQKTRLLISKKGRGAYLGERSLGVQDPGATSCLIMFESIYESYKKLRVVSNKYTENDEKIAVDNLRQITLGMDFKSNKLLYKNI